MKVSSKLQFLSFPLSTEATKFLVLSHLQRLEGAAPGLGRAGPDLVLAGVAGTRGACKHPHCTTSEIINNN